MNKFFSLIILCILSTVTVFGQITYTDASFPQAGDTIKTTTAVSLPITLTPASSVATTWDFSGLVELNTTDNIIEAASTGASFSLFPSSEILRPFIGNLGGTAYTDVTTTAMTNIGGGFEFFNIQLVAPYVDAHTTQQVPLNYSDVHNETFRWGLGANIDSIPFLRQIIDSLGAGVIPGGINPDSIRLGIQGTETRTVDAFGTCVMPNTSVDVLRQIVRAQIGISIEVRVPTFGGFGFWFDVTTLVGGFLPFPTNINIARHDFLAEGVKQPIVSLTLDSAETTVVTIEYLKDIPNVNIKYLEDAIDVSIFPNPAQKTVQIQMSASDLPLNGYNLTMVDMLGRVVFDENAIRNENHQVNVEAIGSGNYIMLLRDEKGRILKREKVEVQH